MKLTRITPMLVVADMDATIRFYCSLLGFACISRGDSWAALSKDEVEVMLRLSNAHEPPEKPKFTGSLYFNSDDVDSIWHQLKDKATVVYPIENFYYGMREFAIHDNNGYMLQFGQEISDPSQIPPPE